LKKYKKIVNNSKSGIIMQLNDTQNDQGDQYYFKIITAGEGGVGKTTLLYRYVDGVFLKDTKMTIGVEFFLKEINIDNNIYKLQLWDLGGEQQFRVLLKHYITGASGALLMFDLTREITLLKIDEWIDLIREANRELPILLLGTKLDLTEKICVDDTHALQHKEKFRLLDYLKISSKTGQNVNESFELITRKIIERIEEIQ